MKSANNTSLVFRKPNARHTFEVMFVIRSPIDGEVGGLFIVSNYYVFLTITQGTAVPRDGSNPFDRHW